MSRSGSCATRIISRYRKILDKLEKSLLTNQSYSQATPKIRDVVLLCDPILPRNDWRLARIIKTKTGSDGVIREVELITSTRRKIRLPLNLITPLGINSTDSETSTTSKNQHNQHNKQRAA
ncbi:unnamed protein product [Heligmosomoides polygyrus]|uniref:DUF5641 domain-containing protein n=1 Tax=Heligmosomoides polygyrus TaxID=6339 RepID=A0A183FW78_HELPZ|nr:unnamed protein product [Heligmosomoides polygyrus]